MRVRCWTRRTVRAMGGVSFLGLGGLSGPFPFPFLPLPSPTHPGAPIPPPNAARGSGGALKLHQRVRAEPGRQTGFGEFQAKNCASGSNGLEELFRNCHIRGAFNKLCHQMSDFKAIMYQIQFRLWLSPRPRWGSLQRSPRPPSWIKGAYF